MSPDGWLPPGTTDADIDHASPRHDEPPFYCWRPEWGQHHCADLGMAQCRECASKDSEENDDVRKDYDEERESGWAV